MTERILTPTKYPVARIPVFSGGNSGDMFGAEHDPSYGREGLYFAPFGVATEEGTSGQEKLHERDVDVYVHPRPEGMTFREWTDGLVDLIGDKLPEGYSMKEALLLLNGCDLLVKGKKFEDAIGPRVINVHPAPLYILTHPDTGEVIDAYGLSTAEVNVCYIDQGFVRRYTGWGEDIMPKILKERHSGATTVHIATKETDHGSNISVRHMERNPEHFDDASSFQNALKDYGDGPAIVAATHMIIKGLEFDGTTLFWEGEAIPYQGLELGDNWEEKLGITLRG